MKRKIDRYPEYIMYEDGRVYDTVRNRYVTIFKNTDGYKQVHLRDKSKKSGTRMVLIHRLLCYVFGNLPCLDSDMEVDHIDNDKNNNNMNNLNAMTREEHHNKTLIDIGMNKRKLSKCIICNLKTKNYKYCSERCFRVSKKVDGDDNNQMIFNVLKTNWAQASKLMGITDNGLRKRYKRYTGLCPKNIKNDFFIDIENNIQRVVE